MNGRIKNNLVKQFIPCPSAYTQTPQALQHYSQAQFNFTNKKISQLSNPIRLLKFLLRFIAGQNACSASSWTVLCFAIKPRESFLEIVDDLMLTPGSITQLPLQNKVARTRTPGWMNSLPVPGLALL